MQGAAGAPHSPNPFYLIYLSREHLAPALRSLMDFVAERLPFAPDHWCWPRGLGGVRGRGGDRLALSQHADLPLDQAGIGAEHQHQLMFIQHYPGRQPSLARQD